MLDKVHGLVFRSIPFGDSSLILHVFTEEMGLQSFIIRSARKGKSGRSAYLFHALHPVEIVAYPPKTGELYQVKEIKAIAAYHDLAFNIFKTSLVLFLDEVLIKTIRQHQRDSALYHFIYNSLSLLDLSTGPFGNYHILFLMQLCRYLGFYPSFEIEFGFEPSNEGKYLFFDLKNGAFLNEPPLHPSYMSLPISFHLYNLWTLNFETGKDYCLSRSLRMGILETLMEYYAFHIDGFGTIKSLDVLFQVFDEKD